MERIETLHPEGKKGVNILKSKYDQVAETILTVLREADHPISFTDMSQAAEQCLIEAKFDGKPLWYITTVKLDLEARAKLRRIPTLHICLNW